jgi:uncharacterized protein YqjF (DUF2071 family)
MTSSRRPFLTARWTELLLLNFDCPPALLHPLVPEGTALDEWQGLTMVSLVGFMFRDTRVFGWAIPAHGTFEEVNLRFYVRRELSGQPARRGVVFIREFVPRAAIAVVARAVYSEPYTTASMAHDLCLDAQTGGTVSYRWTSGKSRCAITGRVAGPAAALEVGSEAEFVTEHYWGYTRQRDGATAEYEVAHPRWRVWPMATAQLDGEPAAFYGSRFGEVLARARRRPTAALGSDITVFSGNCLSALPAE